MTLSGTRFERLEDPSKIKLMVELPEGFVSWVLESRERQRQALASYVPETEDLSEFREEASKRWEEFGLPPAPAPQEDWEPVYIRFGPAPHAGRSFNWQLGEYEPGVVVFNAYRTPDGEYLLDFQDSPLLAITYVRVSSVGRRAYRVYGTPCGTGGGGEPCLSDTWFEPLDDPSRIRPMVELPEEFVEWVLEYREKQRRALAQAQ